MDAVKRAAEAVKNSPLFRKKFCHEPKETVEERQTLMGGASAKESEIDPRKDLTPFVQGLYHSADFLGGLVVPPNTVQDHGCTDEAIYAVWHNPPEPVSVRVTTKSIRIKRSSTKEVLFEFPLFHVSYCGTNSKHKDAFAFVAKSTTDSPFNCYVFKCADAEKAYTLTLTVSKAFYIAYEILQAEQGMFHETPPRDTVFEPQHDTDTKTSPQRPFIDVPDGAARNPQVPVIQLHTSSVSSEDGIEHVSLSSADEDFVRLAKARSNPNILRSTLDHSTVTECNVEALRLYSEPGSSQPTPASSTSNLVEPFD